MCSGNGMSPPAPAMDDRDQLPDSALASPLAASPTPTPPPLDDRPSATSLRSAFRTNIASPGGTVRAVTPELGDRLAMDAAAESGARGLGSEQSSPRSVPGGANRRQGMVFNDSFGDPYDDDDASPPLPSRGQLSGQLSGASLRPRTRTMDSPMLAQRSAPPVFEGRHRVGSISSSTTQGTGGALQATFSPSASHVDDQRAQPPAGLSSSSSSMVYSNVLIVRDSTPPSKHKKSPSRRLLKRQSSRPNSPLISPPPYVDSLPFPVPADDANKVILLMKTLCGRMRGEVEYQGESGGPWHSGIAYIDEEKGCLMFDSGQNGPFHIPLVTDLRGCRVLPVDYPDVDKECLELVSASPAVEIVLCPLVAEEFDLWLAALLSWHQVRPAGLKMANGKASAAPVRPELKRHGSSLNGTKPTNIIKVGKVMLWDKGSATSPRAMLKRASTRDVRSPIMTWRRVSCILQDNGDFKLIMENDVSALSVIELSQLSRSAIQQLDRTVLDEEHCIVIFPTYAAASTHLSIFRPVYIALDNRTHFEVWFTLLRAFAVPDFYKLDDPEKDTLEDVADLETPYNGEVFRVARTINMRVTEAKIRARPASDPMVHEKGTKADADPLVANYVAEVILDGEVRARTMIKPATKNPYWRDDCEFTDLPPTAPYLSVVLKRVEGNLDSLSNQLQASLGLPKTGNLQEIMWGSVDLTLEHMDKSKDHENWIPIMDDKQQSLGSMLIKLSHDEHVVLLEKEYQPLSEILHRFTTGLTTMIAGALPSQLRRLSELFLNIFQVSKTASEWLMALVEDEIDGIGNQASIKKYRFSSRLKSNESIESSSDRELIVRDMGKSLAGEANLLFRGNTLLTQSLECHMRRLGKEYMEEVLQDKLFEINEINPDCEVDPSRLPHGIHEHEVEQHWTQLLHFTTEVWQCIAEAANRIPAELRHILKYIRAVAEDRYGDFLRTVAYTSVSGFLFLRFICPAILSPKLFGLLRDHPRSNAQRTFTLVAKALQKMANLSTFGKREEWMEPMNRFLTAQRPVFRDFIDQVCGIPAERSTALLPASYSTPIAIMGRLGPTAKEGFPSLPYLIDQARSFAGLVKLWTDNDPLDKRNLHVDGELLIFNELCHGLRRRTDTCVAKLEAWRAADAITQPIAEELAETLEQASLIESLSISYGATTLTSELPDPATAAPGSSGSDAPSNSPRRSKEGRRGREGWDARKVSGLRHVSGSAASATLKAKNGKVGRTILSGIMRMGGRGESPDGKHKRHD